MTTNDEWTALEADAPLYAGDQIGTPNGAAAAERNEAVLQVLASRWLPTLTAAYDARNGEGLHGAARDRALEVRAKLAELDQTVVRPLRTRRWEVPTATPAQRELDALVTKFRTLLARVR